MRGDHRARAVATLTGVGDERSPERKRWRRGSVDKGGFGVGRLDGGVDEVGDGAAKLRKATPRREMVLAARPRSSCGTWRGDDGAGLFPRGERGRQVAKTGVGSSGRVYIGLG